MGETMEKLREIKRNKKPYLLGRAVPVDLTLRPAARGREGVSLGVAGQAGAEDLGVGGGRVDVASGVGAAGRGLARVVGRGGLDGLGPAAQGRVGVAGEALDAVALLLGPHGLAVGVGAARAGLAGDVRSGGNCG